MLEIIQEFVAGKHGGELMLLWIIAAIPGFVSEIVFLRFVMSLTDRTELILWNLLAMPAHFAIALFLYPVQVAAIPDWLTWLFILFVVCLGVIFVQRNFLTKASTEAVEGRKLGNLLTLLPGAALALAWRILN